MKDFFCLYRLNLSVGLKADFVLENLLKDLQSLFINKIRTWNRNLLMTQFFRVV